MVILRPTRKLHSLLRLSENAPTMSDTALGDWYVNRVVVNRQPLLLSVRSASLLPMIVPASDVRSLPARLASLVEIRLRRLGLDKSIVDCEIGQMGTVVIGQTIDQSVLESWSISRKESRTTWKPTDGMRPLSRPWSNGWRRRRATQRTGLIA
jgi:Domain of unknown function (DUF6933)